jgi:heat shock protein HslJ
MRLVVPILTAAALAACAPPGSPGDHAAKALSLAGTSWTIAAIDGQPVKTARPTAVRFTKDRIEGNAGCNSFGGSYTLDGDALTVGRLISTKMAWLGTGMEQERAVFAILAQPMTVSQNGEGAVTLNNEAGAMTLAPAR